MTIRIAIVGLGNCATALLEGIEYYAKDPTSTVGLLSPVIDGYRIADIEPVLAFDVDRRKVGRTIGDAARLNDRNHDTPLDFSGPVVKSPPMDGLSKTSEVRYDREYRESNWESPADLLSRHEVDVVVNYLPVGSAQATRYFADAALEARCGFLNCIPVELARDPLYAAAFEEAGLPLLGDDIKSQYGATILHRALVRICAERGIQLDSTYQLNVGGNADFRNMLDQDRLVDKRISKTTSVTDVYHLDDVHIGPSDFVAHLADTKVAFINLEMRGFGGATMRLDAKLEVLDSPNSAGIVVDGIRYLQVAIDRGLGGVLDSPSAFLMKAPRTHENDDHRALEQAKAWLG